MVNVYVSSARQIFKSTSVWSPWRRIGLQKEISCRPRTRSFDYWLCHFSTRSTQFVTEITSKYTSLNFSLIYCSFLHLDLNRSARTHICLSWYNRLSRNLIMKLPAEIHDLCSLTFNNNKKYFMSLCKRQFIMDIFVCICVSGTQERTIIYTDLLTVSFPAPWKSFTF
jgi:hypothetical protein